MMNEMAAAAVVAASSSCQNRNSEATGCSGWWLEGVRHEERVIVTVDRRECGGACKRWSAAWTNALHSAAGSQLPQNTCPSALFPNRSLALAVHAAFGGRRRCRCRCRRIRTTGPSFDIHLSPNTYARPTSHAHLCINTS